VGLSEGGIARFAWRGNQMLQKLLLSIAVIGLLAVPQEASAQQVIFACQNNSSGELKIVAANATCPNNSTLISWAVTGPQGPPGIQGPIGRGLFR
jgi:hypothetical protein